MSATDRLDLPATEPTVQPPATEGAAPGDGAQFTMDRVLRAPLARVWAALTQPEHLLRWFSPDVWVLSRCEVDLRPGGAFRFTMEGVHGRMNGIWRFEEVTAPERLVFVNSFADEAFEVAPAPFSDRFPREVRSVISLSPHEGPGGGTLLSLRSEPIRATADSRAAYREMHGSMREGWGATLDNLDRHVGG